MGHFKTLSALTLLGALLGGIVASLVMPSAIVWYATPGDGIQQVICTPESIGYALRRLLQAQLIGVGVGAVLFLVLGALWIRRSAKKRLPPSSAAPASPGPVGQP